MKAFPAPALLAAAAALCACFASAAEENARWTHIYAGDYGPFPADSYRQLAARGISGFAWQWRGNWRGFHADAPVGHRGLGTVGRALETIREVRREGNFEFMLLIHIYAEGGPRTGPWFDCSNPEDLQGLLDRCRLAAEYGVGHIMILADDWTPRQNNRYVSPEVSEREAFGDSVGKAHGTLMRHLAESLAPDFPDLTLSFCPPVYSLYHCGKSPEDVKYLREFDAEAPKSVYLTWTGGTIITDELRREDHAAFTAHLPSGRKLVWWDNSECFDQPLPLWRTRWYDGAAADHDGIVFLNAHTFGWVWSAPYIDSAVAALTGGDAETAYYAAVERLFGPQAPEPLAAWRARYLELVEAKADPERSARLLAELEAGLERLAAVNPRFRELDKGLASTRNRLAFSMRSVPLPALEAADAFPERASAFDLLRNDNGEPPELTTRVSAAIVGGDLVWQLDCEQPDFENIPRSRSAPRDDTVYLNPESIELFLRSREDGEYGHFVFDCFGHIFDELGTGGADSWNPDWSVAVEPIPGGYRAKVVIPLIELERLGGVDRTPGALWRFNLFRNPWRGAPAQAFSPARERRYHTPEFFGAFRLE